MLFRTQGSGKATSTFQRIAFTLLYFARRRVFPSPRTATRRHTHGADQTAEMYRPTVPGAGRPRQRRRQGRPPSEGTREGSMPGVSPASRVWLALLASLDGTGIARPLHSFSRGRLPLWAPVSVPKLAPRGRTGWFRADPSDLIST